MAPLTIGLDAALATTPSPVLIVVKRLPQHARSDKGAATARWRLQAGALRA